MSQRPSILAVDDSQTIRRSIEYLLKKEGYDVQTVADGYAAIAAIARQPPQLLLLDLVMPRLDGLQVLGLVKQHSRYRNICVILLTSRAELYDRAQALLAGADAYLVKPFKPEGLLDAVQSHLSRGSVR